MSANMIEVLGLTKVFDGKVKAVDHVSFQVREGEVFGFLGPNGAGKTTTINILTTVLRPTEGQAMVAGFDNARQPTEVRRNIGVVPQEYTADEDLTGFENILLCADLYGLPRVKGRVREPDALVAQGDRQRQPRNLHHGRDASVHPDGPNWGALANDFLFLGLFAAFFGSVGIIMSWRFLSRWSFGSGSNQAPKPKGLSRLVSPYALSLCPKPLWNLATLGAMTTRQYPCHGFLRK